MPKHASKAAISPRLQILIVEGRQILLPADVKKALQHRNLVVGSNRMRFATVPYLSVEEETAQEQSARRLVLNSGSL